jgi:hypothetical protein
LCWSYTNTRLTGKTILRKRQYAQYWSKAKSAKRKQIYLDDYLNESGIKKLSDPTHENDKAYVQKVSTMRYNLLNLYAPGDEIKTSFDDEEKQVEVEQKINDALKSKTELSEQDMVTLRDCNRKKLISHIQKLSNSLKLIKSINNYLLRFKGVPKL